MADRQVESTWTVPLRRAGLFQGVDPESVEALANEFEIILDAPRGTTLFNEGEPGESLFIVLSARCTRTLPTSDGRENLVASTAPSCPPVRRAVAVRPRTPSTATATVVTDARVARLPKSALQKWVQDRPQIALQLLRVVARRLRRTNSMLADLIFVDVPGRVANKLLQ